MPQTAPSLSTLNAAQQFVLTVERGVAGNRSANHVAIIT